MAKGGDFYKGEKKKPKKSDTSAHISQPITGGAPTFVLPKMIEKKKKQY